VTDDLPARFREALDRYRNVVLTWPLQDGIEERRSAGGPGRLRVGKPSARIFPRVGEAAHEDDPSMAAMVEVRETPLAEALGIAGTLAVDPQHAWPEESNASRIAEKIRNSSLRREPHPWSPILVHLLGDPKRLHAFLADLAFGRLESTNGDCRLIRDGRELPVGKGSEGLEAAAALDNLEVIARRVVVIGSALDGTSIPEPGAAWDVSPEEALRKVESHPLVRAAQGAPGWAAWRDVILGLALDAGEEARAPQLLHGAK
jgi:hypothetical protein